MYKAYLNVRACSVLMKMFLLSTLTQATPLSWPSVHADKITRKYNQFLALSDNKDTRDLFVCLRKPFDLFRFTLLLIKTFHSNYDTFPSFTQLLVIF